MLSAEKPGRREMPLDFLVERFALDPTTKWRRVYALGDKSEMLVVVRQEHSDAPVRVDFLTDLAAQLVLHWGVCKPGGLRGAEGLVWCCAWGLQACPLGVGECEDLVV